METGSERPDVEEAEEEKREKTEERDRADSALRTLCAHFGTCLQRQQQQLQPQQIQPHWQPQRCAYSSRRVCREACVARDAQS